MPRLTCEFCHYSKPILVDSLGIVGNTDYRVKSEEGLACGYKDGRTCVVDDLNARERERSRKKK